MKIFCSTINFFTMAKQDGTQRFIGRIGDLIYYKRRGQYLVRRANCPSPERIKKSPEFAGTRKLNHEFGAAARIGKELRSALSEILTPVADSELCGKVQGVLVKAIHRGSGEAGCRSFEVSANKELFADFYFSRKCSLSEKLFKDLSIACTSQRNEASLTVPKMWLPKVSGGTGVSHVQVSLSLLVFSDYVYNGQAKKYEPVYPALNGCLVTAGSAFIPVEKRPGLIQVTAMLPVNRSIPDRAGVLAIAGIDFLKEEGGVMYPLRSHSRLKIVGVF